MISREKFLSKTERRYKALSVDGDEYRIQSLTELERTKYELDLQGKKGFAFEKAKRLFLCRTLVDDNGNRIFQDSDVDQMENVDGGLTGLLYDEASTHCGYKKDEIEELVKNSEKAGG